MRNRDIDNSWGFNFSRFNSNGWTNLHLADASIDLSLVAPSNINQNYLQPLIHQQQPERVLFQCLQNCPSDNQDIKEISYLMDNQPQTKKVNHKQYFRIMKRRIKKVLNKLNSNKGPELLNNRQSQRVIENKKPYIYESRHKHAKTRLRGKDGKFIATRSQEDRFREKKKRGRKPKIIIPNCPNLSSTNQTFFDKQPISM